MSSRPASNGSPPSRIRLRSLVPRVLAHGGCGVPGDISRYSLRLIAPRLISHFVDIAVVTGQIAPAVDLDDEIPERDRAPASLHDRGDVQRVRPFGGRSGHRLIKARAS